MRTYKRKRPSPWRDKDKRMNAAMRLRAGGKSLREIGDELAVSYETIRRDLARWDHAHSNVVQLPVTSGRHKLPPQGRDVTAECDSPESHLAAVAALNDRRK